VEGRTYKRTDGHLRPTVLCRLGVAQRIHCIVLCHVMFVIWSAASLSIASKSHPHITQAELAMVHWTGWIWLSTCTRIIICMVHQQRQAATITDYCWIRCQFTNRSEPISFTVDQLWFSISTKIGSNSSFRNPMFRHFGGTDRQTDTGQRI